MIQMFIPSKETNQKAVRAKIIAEYCWQAGFKKVICFSCGNASEALRQPCNSFGLHLVEIAPSGGLTANRWYTPEEIKHTWPDFFDATSGHLPLFLMARIAKAFRSNVSLPHDDCVYQVPSGSGETILCLKMAFPKKRFQPIFGTEKGCDPMPFSPLYQFLMDAQ